VDVIDIQTRHPVTTSPDALPGDALLLMVRKGIRHLPVMDGRRLVGVISDRDLLDVVGWMPGLPPDLPQPGHTVRIRDVMHPNPATISPQDSVVTAAMRMTTRKIGCLPVLERGRLVGIITERDLLRAYWVGWRDGGIDADADDTVEHLMATFVFSITSGTTLEDAVARSHALRVRHLPVVDDGRLLGIVSDRDLRAAIGSGQPQSTPVARFMSGDVITVDPATRISRAAELMLDRHASALPVVGKGQLLGILTVTDLLDHCIESLREPEAPASAARNGGIAGAIARRRSGPRRAATAFAVALLGIGSAAHADVIRVPQDYLHIQVAVNNAVDGDVILIEPALYAGPVDIGARSLTLVVDSGGQASVPRLTIHDLLPGQVVIIRGLGGDGTAFTSGPKSEGLVLARNAGHVRIEDSTFRGAPGTNVYGAPGQHPPGWSAARVFDCLSVVFAHCSFTGGDGASLGDEDYNTFAGSGGAGLALTDSLVSTTWCTLVGGTGGSIMDTVTYGGGAGGSGIDQTGGTLHVMGSALTGSNGGSGDCDYSGCGPGGPGGSGLFAHDEARLIHHGNTFVAGQGAFGGDGVKAPNGLPIDAQQENLVIEFPTRAHDFTATATVRELQPITLHAGGAPGEDVMAWISLLPRWKLLPAHQGVFLVDNGLGFNVLVPLGTTDIAGTLDVSVFVPELGPGLQALPIHAQALFRDAYGVLLLGPASNAVLLDGAY